MEVSEILLTIFWIVLAIGVFIGWFWVVRHYFLRTGNFTCRKCSKKYPQNMKRKVIYVGGVKIRERERERETKVRRSLSRVDLERQKAKK